MQVLGIKKIDDGTRLKGVATISLYDKMEIRGFSIIVEGDKEWIGFPQTAFIRDGKVKHEFLLKVPGDLRKMISSRILAAWYIFQREEQKERGENK